VRARVLWVRNLPSPLQYVPLQHPGGGGARVCTRWYDLIGERGTRARGVLWQEWGATLNVGGYGADERRNATVRAALPTWLLARLCVMLDCSDRFHGCALALGPSDGLRAQRVLPQQPALLRVSAHGHLAGVRPGLLTDDLCDHIARVLRPLGVGYIPRDDEIEASYLLLYGQYAHDQVSVNTFDYSSSVDAQWSLDRAYELRAYAYRVLQAFDATPLRGFVDARLVLSESSAEFNVGSAIDWHAFTAFYRYSAICPPPIAAGMRLNHVCFFDGNASIDNVSCTFDMRCEPPNDRHLATVVVFDNNNVVVDWDGPQEHLPTLCEAVRGLLTIERS
jgi:hypothetical protein